MSTRPEQLPMSEHVLTESTIALRLHAAIERGQDEEAEKYQTMLERMRESLQDGIITTYFEDMAGNQRWEKSKRAGIGFHTLPRKA